MRTYRNKRGMTLIETLIYIGLLSIIMGGSMIAVYQLIESSGKNQDKVVLQEEANFLLRKINYVLNGASGVATTATKLTLTYPPSFGLSSQVIDFSSPYLGLNTVPLNSSNVIVSGPVFTPLSIPSEGIKINFTLTSKATGTHQDFSMTKYLRK